MTTLIELDGKFEEGDKFFIRKESHCGIYELVQLTEAQSVGLLSRFPQHSKKKKDFVLSNCSKCDPDTDIWDLPKHLPSTGKITNDLSTLTNEIFLSTHGISDAIEVKKLVNT